MDRRSAPSADESFQARARVVELAVLGAALVMIALAVLMALNGDGGAAAALGGGLSGGLLGAWAGVVLDRRARLEEPPVAYTVVTHERPGRHTVDLRDEHPARRTRRQG